MPKSRGNTLSMRRWLLAGAIACALAAPVHAQQAGAPSQPMLAATPQAFDIPAGPLARALTRFSEQSGIQVLYEPKLAEGRAVPAYRATAPAEPALEALLRGAGLTWETVDGSTVVLRQGKAEPVAEPAAAPTPAPRSALPPEDEEVTELERIVVTGTHIRSGAPVGSSVITLDRHYLRQGGYSSVADMLEALPQASGSGASLDGIFLGGATPNPAFGSAANLRGLGPQSTLTLLNGRRLPASGNGNFTDLSLIPVSAIERVDVLLDGASALYGSDAVGGVVNLVTARDYEGADTSVRRGIATNGGGAETRLAQTLGVRGARLGALLTYEYQANDAVFGEQRPFATGQPGAFTLLPQQRRHGALLSSTLAVGQASELFLDATYARRKVHYLNFSPLTLLPYETDTANDQFGISVGARLPFADDWQLEVAVDYGKNAIDSVSREAVETRSSSNTSLWAGGFKADGTLWQLPAGPMKMALGAGMRHEDLAVDRTVRYAFAEAIVPLVSGQQGVPGMRSLTLSLAGRYERYSDFGSTANPKLGFRWETGETMMLRGSYGRSFRAPGPYELNEETRTNLLFDLPDGSGATRSLLLFGGNADFVSFPDPQTPHK